MGNGGAEGSGSGLVFVDMNPLMIIGRLGKQVDLLLRYGKPRAGRHILSDTGLDFIKVLKLFFHFAGYPCICESCASRFQACMPSTKISFLTFQHIRP